MWLVRECALRTRYASTDTVGLGPPPARTARGYAGESHASRTQVCATVPVPTLALTKAERLAESARAPLVGGLELWLTQLPANRPLKLTGRLRGPRLNGTIVSRT